MTLAYFDMVFAFAVVMLLLSLFITVLVQLAISLLNLRGRSLLWGIEQIINSYPGLRGQARTLAEKILKHESISPRGRLAKAIGSDELKSILKEIYSELERSKNENDRTVLAAIKDVIPASMVSDEKKQYLEGFVKQFEALFPQEMEKVNSAVRIFEEKASGLLLNIDTWFDTVMRRTTEHFLLRTRFWTVLFAAVLTLIFNVDSLKLLKDISANSGLRESLISSADRTLEKAEEVLYAEPIASSALKSVKDRHPQELPGDLPADLVSVADGEDWIEKNVKAEDQKKVLEDYRDAYDELAGQRLSTVLKQARELKVDLEQARLAIVPADWLWNDWRGWGHLIGLLMTIAFLSLGAPFWFSALKGLSALRPIIGGKIDPSKGEQTR